MMRDNSKLRLWQRRLSKLETDYAESLDLMAEREAYYLGTETVTDADGDPIHARHIRNIVAENIEAQVSSSIPAPKVRALHAGDEGLAEVIERLIRDDLDRLPMERINDLDERTTPIQGGDGFLVDWEQDKRFGDRSGDISITLLHPKMILPQTGVTEVEDMDYFILRVPETKTSILAKYGVDVTDEGEDRPEIRSGEDTEKPDDEIVTLYVGYERTPDGIAKYGFVNDTEVFDLENYRARRGMHCRVCGAAEPLDGSAVSLPLGDLQVESSLIARAMGQVTEVRADAEAVFHSGDPCPFCGAKDWVSGAMREQTLYSPVETARGTVIPASWVNPVRIPECRPDGYPLSVRKNVSVFGQFLGDSDVDKIMSQQDVLAVVENKIIHRFCDAGTRISLPNDPEVTLDKRDQRVIHVRNASDLASIRTFDFSGNLSQEMAFVEQVYQEARQAIGITSSYLGERDTTAQSGAAKQISARQAAGRLESKRVMKEACYQDIFRRLFLLHLAYDDQPRKIAYLDGDGKMQWDEFNRYDFLRKEADGSYSWNLDFAFSCDAAQPLANNREGLWQETANFYQSGAFGDPTQDETRRIFWEAMERLHYPGAGAMRKAVEARMERASAEQQAQMMQGKPADGSAVDEMARRDAMRDVMGVMQ